MGLCVGICWGVGVVLNKYGSERVTNRKDDILVKTRKGEGGNHAGTQRNDHSGRKQEQWQKLCQSRVNEQGSQEINFGEVRRKIV